MKQPTRGALLGFGIALAAFAAVSLLATLSLRGERERNRLLAQYEAERIASGLFLIVAQAAAGGDVDASLTEPTLHPPPPPTAAAGCQTPCAPAEPDAAAGGARTATSTYSWRWMRPATSAPTARRLPPRSEARL